MDQRRLDGIRKTMKPTTHDFTDRCWGQDYAITSVSEKGLVIGMTGWGHGLKRGDFILLESQSTDPDANKDTRYKVKSIEYRNNPRDMWSVVFTFAPRVLEKKP